MKTKILIIGGCGYLGSALYLHLKKQKQIVTTCDLEIFGNFVNPNNLKINYNKLSKKFLDNFDSIILLAGYSSVAMCRNKMKDTFKNNVIYFNNLLNKITHQTFIYASSSSVYGNTGGSNANEKVNNYVPSNYYDLSKKEIDYYAHLSGLNYYGLRLGTVNGLSPNLRIDLMINKMYFSAIKERKIIVYNRSSIRPILGMNDFCRSIETIISKSSKRGIYNIASFNMKILDIATCISKKFHVPIVDNGVESSYNFSISSKQFTKTFNFTFQDNINTILDTLVNGWRTAKLSVRI